DTSAFLFMLLVAACYLRLRLMPSPGAAPRFLFLVSSCLLALSKSQHALVCAPLLFLFWQRNTLLWPSRPLVSRLIATGALVGCVLFAFVHTPRGYTTPPLFTVIALGLVPSSANPDMELRELGLPGSFRQYAGKTAYSSGSPLLDPAW